MTRTPRTIALTFWTLLVGLGVVDCECIDHPLYDVNVNRFDTWYLGGGNSQFRPFRQGDLDPDALFDGEILLAPQDDRVHLRVLLDATEPEAVLGEVRVGARVLGELGHVGGDVLELDLDRDAFARTLAQGDVQVVLWTEGGGELEASIGAADLQAAVAARTEGSR